MTGLADTNLVVAAIDPRDGLHARALAHLRTNRGLTMTTAIGLELLLVMRKRGDSCVEALAAAEQHFEIENADAVYAAAEAMDTRALPTTFDALHLAEAALRGTTLHTADERLLRSPYPTTAF